MDPAARTASVKAPVLDALRAGTHQAHTRLEGLTGLLDPALTHDRYVQALARLLAVVKPLEASITSQMPHRLQPFLAPRRKAGLLRDDLAFWARAGIEPGVVAAVELPVLGTAARAFGALYVLEGATLGGSVIAPHAERCLGFAPGAGSRYFRAYGDSAGRMWREFRTVLAGEVDLRQSGAAVAAANDTFNAFGAAFAPRP